MGIEPKTNRIIGGRNAALFGKTFEHMFKLACNSSGLPVTRVPDGCKQIGPKKLIRVQSPFDWIVSFKSQTALLDTKTIDAATFASSRIDDNQLFEMTRHELHGAIGGYVIWFRKTNIVVFVSAKKLFEFKKLKQSISVGIDGVIVLGDSLLFDVRKIFKQDRSKYEVPDGREP